MSKTRYKHTHDKKWVRKPKVLNGIDVQTDVRTLTDFWEGAQIVLHIKWGFSETNSEKTLVTSSQCL